MDRVVGFRKALTQPKFNPSKFYSGEIMLYVKYQQSTN